MLLHSLLLVDLRWMHDPLLEVLVVNWWRYHGSHLLVSAPDTWRLRLLGYRILYMNIMTSVHRTKHGPMII